MPRQDQRATQLVNVVPVQGRITIDNSDEMRRKLRDTLRSRPDQVTVDLSAVTYIDTSGLATLFEAVRIAREQKTRLVLTGLRGQPRQLLEETQLASLFDIPREEARV